MRKYIKNPFKTLTKFEMILWICSVIAVALSMLISPERDAISIIASVIGVTALIFLAKGQLIGQVLVIIFATLYGIVSFRERYYGEMITYMCMSAPMAFLSIFSWLKNPYGDSGEVRVNRLKPRTALITVIIDVCVTVAFYFILRALDTASLIWSTISVATSFLAASLTFLRSPYYALGYAVNDVVLIVLWVISSVTNPASIAMVVCFGAFLFNDLYGFISWRRMEDRQSKNKTAESAE